MNKKQTEDLIRQIFKLCDKTVWLDDFKEFQDEFAKILKKRGFNLWKIYFGVETEMEWRNKCKKAVQKYREASRRNETRAKDKDHCYIKNRAYKMK